MNRRQKICLWMGLCVFSFAGLRPPWFKEVVRMPRWQYDVPGGFAFLWNPPETGQIDFARLLVEWALVTVVTLVLLVTLKRDPLPSTSTFSGTRRHASKRTTLAVCVAVGLAGLLTWTGLSYMRNYRPANTPTFSVAQAQKHDIFDEVALGQEAAPEAKLDVQPLDVAPGTPGTGHDEAAVQGRESARDVIKTLEVRHGGGPSTGTDITAPFGPPGLGVLKITNGTSDDAVVRLVDLDQSTVRRFVFLRAGEHLNLRGIGKCRCALRFGLGRSWSAQRQRFLVRPHYSEFADRLHFNEYDKPDGIHYGSFDVTLHPVTGGRARVSPVSEEQFFSNGGT